MTTVDTAKQLAAIPRKKLVSTLRPRLSEIVETTKNGIAEIMDTAKVHARERHAAWKNLANI
ncbi:hypothetical protein [Methylocystis echinoides]|uniref:hypothetical protein n=1 Tax=Methylocystis echinoides TaxID=29468 RepID=UPI002491BF7F|nr:hypothetical protein [Methylocystis echinoides]